MVTPKRISAFSMVGFLCVITINCVSAENFFKYFAYLATFASSSAASISSSTQKGIGRIPIIANKIAIAVSARSPPDKREILVSFLPGGHATISMPAFNGSSQSV